MAAGLDKPVSKAALRQQAKLARLALSAQARSSKSAAIASRLSRLKVFKQAQTVFLFAGVGSEVDTSFIRHMAGQQMKVVALPRVVLPARDLEFHRVENLALDTEPGPASIPEPKTSCPLVPPDEADLVIVPGLAFDRRGHRIGSGAGFYDRWLVKWPLIPRVGVLFEVQLFDSLPAEDHDQPLQWLVTESRAIRCSCKDEG
jgi:5-formyltetrahydrofolate cyclo-ligase